MKIKLLASVLCVCSAMASAVTLHHQKSPKDPGVINEQGIIYWMTQRGELAVNATDKQKRQALKDYLGKRSFKPKHLPGSFGKQTLHKQSMAYARHSNNSKGFASKNGGLSRAAQNVNAVTEEKILAIMIDFPDHQADQNTYPVSHYNDLIFSQIGDANDITSAYKYYQAESGGTMRLIGSANGWVRAENNAAHYGANDPDKNNDDKNVRDLVIEAVTKAVSELDIVLNDYDTDKDGIIDHVMIFHSSIGEEAGGGELGDDAIWSHRYFVFDPQDGQPVSVPGSNIKLYGYTINPIDARIGVVSHEFGHDLGVPDEYDIDNGTFSSPVGDWSIMASGSWVDGGLHPSGFSPYARDYFQNRYGGNWINQQEINFSDLTTASFDLVRATNHQQGLVNQLKVNLPLSSTDFQPYLGYYQFYSSEGHDLNSVLSFDVALPGGASSLTMKAHWNIETDWDYLVVKVNDVVIAGNHTSVNNPELPEVHNYLSADSLSIEGAEGELGWVDLTYDLSAYQNQTVTIKIEYVTDTLESGYGFVADNIIVANSGNQLFTAGAEQTDEVSLAGGFIRTAAWSRASKPHHYYIQLRNHTITDKFLANERYDQGILVWYRDENVEDNRVNAHPGEVFIGVVDADQNPIKQGTSFRDTYSQITDAAFSLYQQALKVSGDNHLAGVTVFDDKLDYSAPYQPESGINLPKFGLTMEVISQASDSENATIELKNSPLALVDAEHDGLTISFAVSDDNALDDTGYLWDFGDNTNAEGKNVIHSYATGGAYEVTVTYQTADGQKVLSHAIVVGEKISGDFSATIEGMSVSFTPDLTGGEGQFSYRWDFGDDSEIVNEVSPTHSYQQHGTYTVTLTVVDDTLQSFVFSQDVTIENVLAVSFTHNANDLNVSFSANATGGDENYGYAWDFGDGGTSNLQNPSHSFANAGSYTVTLTVTDGNGQTSDASATVTVRAAVVTTPTSSKKSSGGGSSGLVILALFGIGLLRKKKAC